MSVSGVTAAAQKTKVVPGSQLNIGSLIALSIEKHADLSLVQKRLGNLQILLIAHRSREALV